MRLQTAQIVRKIRCEAREAVKDKLGIVLTYVPHAYAQKVGYGLLYDTIDVTTVDLRPLPQGIKDAILKYGNTAIAYNFSFDGSENNRVGGTVSSVRTSLTETQPSA